MLLPFTRPASMRRRFSSERVATEALALLRRRGHAPWCEREGGPTAWRSGLVTAATDARPSCPIVSTGTTQITGKTRVIGHVMSYASARCSGGTARRLHSDDARRGAVVAIRFRRL